MQAARQAYVEELRAGRAAAPDEQLCATPFGVDVVGITEFVALTGALVGGACVVLLRGAGARMPALLPGCCVAVGPAGRGTPGTIPRIAMLHGIASRLRPDADWRSDMDQDTLYQLLPADPVCALLLPAALRCERAPAEAGAGAPERAAAHHQHAAQVRGAVGWVLDIVLQVRYTCCW